MKSLNLYFCIFITTLAVPSEGQSQRADFNDLGHDKKSSRHGVSKRHQPKALSEANDYYEYYDSDLKFISHNNRPENIQNATATTTVPPDLITAASSLTNKREENINSKDSVVDTYETNTFKDFQQHLYRTTTAISCRHVMNSELNENGEIIDSIKQVCDPLPNKMNSNKITKKHITSTTTTVEPKIETTTEWYYRKKSFTTPLSMGINCRRVMNSEFNENGEIIDSVTEVCDRPTTTTTTTTMKPIVMTTTEEPIINTTPPPNVTVCWPVMNSVLDDNGEIIDSVTEVCSLVPAT